MPVVIIPVVIIASSPASRLRSREAVASGEDAVRNACAA
jgi:hypothetical protein